MKYNELQIGDMFTVEREKHANIYVKQEFYDVYACNRNLRFKKYNGNTKVRLFKHD